MQTLSANPFAHFHQFEPDKFLVGLHRLQAMQLVGSFIPAPCETYRLIRQQVQSCLLFGIPESNLGDDPVERMINGLEESGLGVRSGTKHIAIESRFVGAMVLALRCALGRLPRTEANVLVVGREYRRLCRAKDVRCCVQESNRALVEDVYFKEECLDSIVRHYSRLPRWVSALMWVIQPKEKFWELFTPSVNTPKSYSC